MFSEYIHSVSMRFSCSILCVVYLKIKKKQHFIIRFFIYIHIFHARARANVNFSFICCMRIFNSLAGRWLESYTYTRSRSLYSSTRIKIYNANVWRVWVHVAQMKFIGIGKLTNWCVNDNLSIPRSHRRHSHRLHSNNNVNQNNTRDENKIYRNIIPIMRSPRMASHHATALWCYAVFCVMNPTSSTTA